METQALLQQLNESGELQLRPVVTIEELVAVLAQRVATMIQNEPDLLFQLLYRIDVKESLVQEALANPEFSPDDAAKAIARLIIERQWQKIESRRKYPQDPHDGDGEERW